MIEKVGTVKNPLTIIAIFSGIAEISGTVILPFIGESNQLLYIWFLILFPTALILFFFGTLNFNHKVLYAPSDYHDETNFMKLFEKASVKETIEKAERESFEIESESGIAQLAVPQVDSTSENTTEKSEVLELHNGIKLNELGRLNRVVVAEKAGINFLIDKTGIPFETDVKYYDEETKISALYDGMYVDRKEIHIAEIKLYEHSRIAAPIVNNLNNWIKRTIDSFKNDKQRKIIIHIVIVSDNKFSSQVIEKIYKNFSEYAKFEIDVISFSELLKNYEEAPNNR